MAEELAEIEADPEAAASGVEEDTASKEDRQLTPILPTTTLPNRTPSQAPLRSVSHTPLQSLSSSALSG